VTTKASAKDQPENVLSLVYRGALPEILRAIATELESASANAEHFTSRVCRDTFELSVLITLIPK
jgi:hypothetical protein